MTRRLLRPYPARRLLAFFVMLMLVVGLAGWQTGIRLGPTVAAQDASAADITSNELSSGGGGGKNVVQVKNQKDGRLRIRGNIQVNHIPASKVAPVNFAYAEASCSDCQTIAVALQIDLIGTHATQVTPQNAAVAVNYQCTRCITAAVALQYVYSVDDPTKTPDNVGKLVHAMNKELDGIAKDKKATVADALTRIDAVIAEFQELAASLDDQRDEATQETSPQATPADFASPVASPVGSPNAGLTPVTVAASDTPTPATAATEPVVLTPTAAIETAPTEAPAPPTDTPIPTSTPTPATPTG